MNTAIPHAVSSYPCAAPFAENVSSSIIDQKFAMQEKKRVLRPDQAGKWHTHYLEIEQYKMQHNHCLVPHSYPENPELARWVKRQRYQYKLFRQGKPTSMSRERIEMLEKIGFVWDSHKATWDKMYHELLGYKREYGNCEVPTKFVPNPPLATWVNRQRGQYKLYRAGKQSSMTLERFIQLEDANFVWEVRPARKTPAEKKASEEKASEKKASEKKAPEAENAVETTTKRKAADQEQIPNKVTKKQSKTCPKAASKEESVSEPISFQNPDLFFDVICDFSDNDTMGGALDDLEPFDVPLMGPTPSSNGGTKPTNRDILRDVLHDIDLEEDGDFDEPSFLMDSISTNFDAF
mmetsp:Transcript_8640/g.13325  ORF Transcript_8640/g.13325 Transcript_8640/m.13325 type:complete len:350 (+) Transcript_8640:211-1260(+)|eukprot:CAMPEP_0178929694 /NCGR_PEP_ID=MMETSP0786-20121207/20769_1 /TAXON_ID=186022 /ORGANISM="Thalassionema frauenfeldii, Strain CCMP 1798" /LENGTH=349 /DNA_ID=CAMNT_0020606033 /DNA_START=151 /DNA_END=1200 /DNA_ORIENTATION=+